MESLFHQHYTLRRHIKKWRHHLHEASIRKQANNGAEIFHKVNSVLNKGKEKRNIKEMLRYWRLITIHCRNNKRKLFGLWRRKLGIHKMRAVANRRECTEYLGVWRRKSKWTSGNVVDMHGYLYWILTLYNIYICSFQIGAY